MKNITLKFSSLQSFASFIRTVEGGYYANTARLTVKGYFSATLIEVAKEKFKCEVLTSEESLQSKTFHKDSCAVAEAF